MSVKASLAVFCLSTIVSALVPYPPRELSASIPWPSIPTPKQYLTPTGPSSVCPSSVIKGLKVPSANSTASLPLTFDNIGDQFTFDYGVDVAGKPFFNISSLEEYAQIEVKYSETFVGLLQPQSDGPFSFANSLAGTFRVETFNVTEVGIIASNFIQGSQRWQSIRLITGKRLKISNAGFISTVDRTPLSSIEGYFASSNSTYTNIWALGPRTQQLVCFSPGTQTSTWSITKNGAYIKGQKPATTARVVNLVNYTMSFETMIDYGGTGWRVDTEIDAIQATGPICRRFQFSGPSNTLNFDKTVVLTSEYPEGSFGNIDRSLVPPNTLVVGRGWSLQNQTSLPGYVLDKFPLPIKVTEKIWHNIKTVSPGDNTYTVYFDDLEIAHFNISTYGLGNSNDYIPGGVYKSFAFGPWQDQAAYVRNVNVTLSTGEKVYSNSMLSDDVLIEYGVHTNDRHTCSDSGKRDRFSWLGDRLISARTVMIGTGQGKFVWGPAEEAFSRQISSGQVPINTLFGPLDTEGILIRTTNVDPLLVDYSFDFMQVIYNYWLSSGNDTFLNKNWPLMVATTSYAVTRSLDEMTQLYGALSGPRSLPLGGEKGQSLGPANTVSLILGLERMADMADYIGYSTLALQYRAQAELSRRAIDTLLWNATGGFYAATIGADGYDLMDIAQVLLAKIGTPERRKEFTSKLSALKVPAGYINGTRFLDTPGIVNPYYTSFLLEGLAKAGETELAQGLLDDGWSPMVRRDSNYTGGYWEYVSIDGKYPGLDLFTGQSHFWGSYPTTFLTEYVLGIRPTSSAYSKFLFAPLPGFKTTWVHGRVPTPKGLIYAAWGYNSDGKIIMEVTAPSGTNGTVLVPFNGTYSMAGKSGLLGNFVFSGGNGTIIIIQE